MSDGAAAKEVRIVTRYGVAEEGAVGDRQSPVVVNGAATVSGGVAVEYAVCDIGLAVVLYSAAPQTIIAREGAVRDGQSAACSNVVYAAGAYVGDRIRGGIS